MRSMNETKPPVEVDEKGDGYFEKRTHDKITRRKKATHTTDIKNPQDSGELHNGTNRDSERM